MQTAGNSWLFVIPAVHADIRDVFVTDDGTRSKPVLGWLTNVDLARIL